MRKRTAIPGIALAAALGYLLAWPTPLDPASWTPPIVPTAEHNSALASATIVPIDGAGPEDVAIDAQGRVYLGLEDGRILRTTTDGLSPHEFTNTGGRPLGMHFDRDGNLIVADASKGLLSVTSTGTTTVLATEHNGVPFKFTDDVDIGPDGVIYFSDASSKWDQPHFREAFFDHRPRGRLLAYHPTTGKTELLADGLYFANGVAVAPDGSFLLLCESTKYRIIKVALTGPDRGHHEVLIDNLPGIPDGISTGTDGIFWLALFSPRTAALDKLLPHPWLRKVVYRLPKFVQPDATRHGIVFGVRADGTIVHRYEDPRGTSFSPITSVEEHRGTLYLGSLEYPGFATFTP